MDEGLAVTATILTTTAGIIKSVDAGGAALIGRSPYDCVGRDLLVSFAGRRPDAADAMRRASLGETVHGSAAIRPLDRAPVPVTYVVRLQSEAAASLEWQFTRVPAAA
jgi:hypothetical protein